MSESIVNFIKALESFILAVLKALTLESIEVFLTNPENNNAKKIPTNAKTDKLIKLLFNSRSNSYGLTPVLNALESVLMTNVPKHLTIIILYYDKFTVRSIDLKSKKYKEQAKFWKQVDTDKPADPIYTIEKVIIEKTRTTTEEEQEPESALVTAEMLTGL